MNYEDELDHIESEAEDQFDDYDGYDDDMDYEDEFDTGFEGNEDAYDDYDEDEYEYVDVEDDDYDDYDDEDEMYDDYKSTSIGKIDPNDRTLTVVVRNTSDEIAEAVIFGGNESAPQIQGVEVRVEESSHQEVREESKSHPFLISGMKMSVSDPLQFDNVLRLAKRTATGKRDATVFQPRNSTSPQNFTSNLIDSNLEFHVTGQTSIRFNVNPNTTVVFTFTVKARANLGNLLDGKNVAELSSTPRTTGLPQLDFRKPKPTNAFGLRKRRKKRKRRMRRVYRPVRARRRYGRPKRRPIRRRR